MTIATAMMMILTMTTRMMITITVEAVVAIATKGLATVQRAAILAIPILTGVAMTKPDEPPVTVVVIEAKRY